MKQKKKERKKRPTEWVVVVIEGSASNYKERLPGA